VQNECSVEDRPVRRQVHRFSETALDDPDSVFCACGGWTLKLWDPRVKGRDWGWVVEGAAEGRVYDAV